MSNNSKVIREIQLQQTPYPGYHRDMEARFAPIGGNGQAFRATAYSATYAIETQGYPADFTAAEIEKTIHKWNWGAFFFSWIWGVFNGLTWPIIVPLLALLSVLLGNFYLYIAANVIGLGVPIYLGIKGNALALQNCTWTSLDGFRKYQRGWAKAALWIFIAVAILISLVFSLLGAAVFSSL